VLDDGAVDGAVGDALEGAGLLVEDGGLDLALLAAALEGVGDGAAKDFLPPDISNFVRPCPKADTAPGRRLAKI
jgi:hypothetical protein